MAISVGRNLDQPGLLIQLNTCSPSSRISRGRRRLVQKADTGDWKGAVGASRAGVKLRQATTLTLLYSL
jgi:hypothetical protein